MKKNEVKKVAIIGCGTMGAGIALACALSGIKVSVCDIKQTQVDLGYNRIKYVLRMYRSENMASEYDLAEIEKKISIFTNFEDSLVEANFIIEAIPENIILKKKLFLKLEKNVENDVIITSNTSGLSITDIASVCENRDRICGFHWFNPPELIPLVEIVRGDNTSDSTVKKVFDFAKSIGKTPIIVNKDIPGFIANRLQYALFREALYLIQQKVASFEDIDIAVRCGIGYRWACLGPIETADLGGLDIFHSVSDYLFKHLDDNKKPQPFFSKMVENGNIGIKSGSGFYKYEMKDKDEIIKKRDIFLLRLKKLKEETV